VSQKLAAESLSAYFQRAGWRFHSVGHRDRTKATRCPATRPPAGTKATRCPATRPHAGTWHTLPPARPHPHVAAFCRDPVRPRHPPAYLPTHSTSSRSLLRPPSPARIDCSTTHHACVFASRRTFAITFPLVSPPRRVRRSGPYGPRKLLTAPLCQADTEYYAVYSQTNARGGSRSYVCELFLLYCLYFPSPVPAVELLV